MAERTPPPSAAIKPPPGYEGSLRALSDAHRQAVVETVVEIRVAYEQNAELLKALKTISNHTCDAQCAEGGCDCRDIAREAVEKIGDSDAS